MKPKIINDPVYGFLRFPEPEVMAVMNHPYFQRLRRIKQMGMAHLVYPGATHSRFHHSLGACHLMQAALEVLKSKGIRFTKEECVAARLAILLHDVGHGPFSHALEHSLIQGISHEDISLLIMQRMNEEMGGILSKAIRVFDTSYAKPYLHALVSSQLDVDRMDYLNRDSFYSGVSEGVIGYDRILQMLTVADGQLMVEEKGLHSVEKFIIARRLMYWQVYLHKTVHGAEQLIVNILKRAKELASGGDELFGVPALQHFLGQNIDAAGFRESPGHLKKFCALDDADITSAIKVWTKHDDEVLRTLSGMLVNRKLYKVILRTGSVEEEYEVLREKVRTLMQCSEADLRYYICTGSTINHTYDERDDRIMILMKNGEAKDLSAVDDPLVNPSLARPVHKNYICYIASSPGTAR